MGNGRWTPLNGLCAAAAFAAWAATVATARFVLHMPTHEPHLRGVASAAEPSREERGRLIDALEVGWRDWVLRRDGVPMRDLAVHVVADEEFQIRVGAGWEKDVRARMARASAVYEREFRVRLVVRSVGDWRSADLAPSIHELHADLARETAADPADFTIAFSSQHARAHSAVADSYDRGVAYYYGRCCIVRAGKPSDGSAWPYEDETVLHEVGHLFGAWHSADSRSVMRASKAGPQRSQFDVCARTAILAARDLDFRRGSDSVDDPTVDALFAAWSVSHPPDAEFPPWQALCTEGWWAQRGGDAGLAVRRCDRALALDQRLGPFVRPHDFGDLVSWAEARRRR